MGWNKGVGWRGLIWNRERDGSLGSGGGSGDCDRVG